MLPNGHITGQSLIGRHIRFIEAGKVAVGGCFVPSKNSSHFGQIQGLKPAKALRFRIDSVGSLRASVSASSGEFNLTPEIIQLLCLIQKGIKPSLLAQELKSEFSTLVQNLPDHIEINELLGELHDAQCLVSPETSSVGSGIDDGFGDAWIQWAMLSDNARCNAYLKAVHELTSSHSFVLDVGAGSGLLSLYALEAGAQRVDAIEETAIARSLKTLRDQLPTSLRNKLMIQNCNSFDAKIPETTNLVLSELFGNDPLQEGIIPTLGDIFSRIKNQRCLGIPDSFTFYVQLIDVTGGPLHQRVQLFASDISTKNDVHSNALKKVKSTLNLNNISFVHPIRTTDFKPASARQKSISVPLAPPPSVNSRTPAHEFELKSEFRVSAPAIIIGFRAYLTKKVTISNIPGEKDFCEHWSPILVPLKRNILEKEKLHINLSISEAWDKVLLRVNDNKKTCLGYRQ